MVASNSSSSLLLLTHLSTTSGIKFETYKRFKKLFDEEILGTSKKKNYIMQTELIRIEVKEYMKKKIEYKRKE